MARLKQAKEEADKEIAEFRAQMEAEFQKKLAEVSTDHPINSLNLHIHICSIFELLPLSLPSLSLSLILCFHYYPNRVVGTQVPMLSALN